MSTNYQDQDYELLSAYIDGELSDSERIALEQRLENDPALRAELASLRQTVALINQLPPRKAPRDFILTRSMARRPIPFPLSATFSTLSTAAALLLFVFGAYFLLQSDAANLGFSQSEPEAPVAQQMDTAVALAATDTALPSPTFSPVPTRPPATPSPLPTLPPSIAEESDGDTTGESNFALQAPPAADEEGAAPAESAESAADTAGGAADDSTELYSSEVQPDVAVTSAVQAMTATPETGALGAEEEMLDAVQATATMVREALNAADPTLELQESERAISNRQQVTPPETGSPLLSIALFALGGLLLLAALLTTIIRRRRQP